MKAQLLFEQSGTFKKEFKSFGWEAYDFDILNDFNETDYVIDLFKEIEKAYDNQESIFDGFGDDDLLMAFFPCVRFEKQINLWFRGENWGQRNWTDKQKIEYDMKLHKEQDYMYQLISKLVIVCLDRKIKLIIENPATEEHYLKRYWCIKAQIVDDDRRFRGDYYKKPTQYWFINCEPKNNLILENIQSFSKKTIVHTSSKVERSLISPEYANRFIREFIL